jgi:glycosyltransferase involved in cell wall biosynthesis
VAARRFAGRAVPGPVRHVLMTADAVGGVWRYTIDLATALGARGVRTTVAVMGPSPTAAQRREADRRGVVLVDRPYRLEWMEDAWQDVARAGKWLLTLERTLEPDVVHLNGYAHAVLPWATPAVLVVAHSCVRTWWRAVKGEEAPARLDAYRASVAAGLAAARVVVAPSADMRDGLTREYGLPLRARVIPNGSSPVAADGVMQAKEPIVFSAGRVWDAAKNITALCAVAGEVRWPVYIAGDGRRPDGADCGLAGVHALGFLAGESLAAWYARAAIYALPARYEPFGLSVLEAAHSGCALVLGDIGSLRENWDGAAEFVAPDDRRALAAAIQGLIDDPRRRHVLGQRAAGRARSLTIDNTADQYLRLYEELAR